MKSMIYLITIANIDSDIFKNSLNLGNFYINKEEEINDFFNKIPEVEEEAVEEYEMGDKGAKGTKKDDEDEIIKIQKIIYIKE